MGTNAAPADEPSPGAATPSGSARAGRVPWAELLRRVFPHFFDLDGLEYELDPVASLLREEWGRASFPCCLHFESAASGRLTRSIDRGAEPMLWGRVWSICVPRCW
jgi:hypothetical protein